MTKSEFISTLESGYTDGCVIKTSEVIDLESGDVVQVEGIYAMLSLEDAFSFFSENYDDTMTRSGHGTRILSCSFSIE